MFTFWLTIFSLEAGFWDDMTVCRSDRNRLSQTFGAAAEYNLDSNFHLTIDHRAVRKQNSYRAAELSIIGLSAHDGTPVAYGIDSQEDD